MSGVQYHEINEAAARIAHEMNSHSSYKEGQATAGYRAAVDAAVALGEQQKSRVGIMHHAKIDGMVAAYSRALARWWNRRFAIESMYPSVLVAGPANFNNRKKEKQNRARDAHWKEHDKLTALLRRIETFGTGGISADDPDALEKLREKLAHLENGGGAGRMATNVSAEKRRLKDRIAELERRKNAPPTGWDFDGGRAVANVEDNRLQLVFDDKPDEATRAALKGRGFRWSPRNSAWQRQLTNNAVQAARQIVGCCRPE